MGFLEGFAHVLDVLLGFGHLVLDILNLALLLGHLSATLFDFFLESLSALALLFFGHVSKFFMSLDLSFDVLILLFDHINIRVEHVNVVVEGVVLLLSLDEGCDNFFGGENTGLLLDLSKGVFDDIDVSNVHIHQVLLLFVVVDPFLESELEEGNWVGELTSVGSGSLVYNGAHTPSLGLIHI